MRSQDGITFQIPNAWAPITKCVLMFLGPQDVASLRCTNRFWYAQCRGPCQPLPRDVAEGSGQLLTSALSVAISSTCLAVLVPMHVYVLLVLSSHLNHMALLTCVGYGALHPASSFRCGCSGPCNGAASAEGEGEGLCLSGVGGGGGGDTRHQEIPISTPGQAQPACFCLWFTHPSNQTRPAARPIVACVRPMLVVCVGLPHSLQGAWRSGVPCVSSGAMGGFSEFNTAVCACLGFVLNHTRARACATGGDAEHCCSANRAVER